MCRFSDVPTEIFLLPRTAPWYRSRCQSPRKCIMACFDWKEHENSCGLNPADGIVRTSRWQFHRSHKAGRPVNDTDGKRIQAHSVGITKMGNQYYWFGEDRTQGLDPSLRYVSCYVSADLIRWKFLGRPLQVASVEGYTGHWVLERPKVYYDAARKRFVMYFH